MHARCLKRYASPPFLESQDFTCVDKTSHIFQIDEVLREGVGDLKEKLPTLLVLNKKDLIKPGEIAKKLQVCAIYLKKDLYSNFIFKFLSPPIAHVLEQKECICSVIFILPKLENSMFFCTPLGAI